MPPQDAARPMQHEVERQLDLMLAHEIFSLRPQQAKLLEFVVKGFLAEEEMTEKHLRSHLFPSPPYKRESNIARRTVDLVRGLLASYYNGPGQEDLVIIALPQSPQGRRKKVQPGDAYTPIVSYNPRHRLSQLYQLGEHYCPAKILEGHPNPLKISVITQDRSENDLN